MAEAVGFGEGLEAAAVRARFTAGVGETVANQSQRTDYLDAALPCCSGLAKLQLYLRFFVSISSDNFIGSSHGEPDYGCVGWLDAE